MGKRSQRRKARADKRNRDPNKLIKKLKKREERIARKAAQNQNLQQKTTILQEIR
jgi:hypothetical protein